IVTIYAQYANQAFLELATGQSVELNAFIIPVDGLSISENWKLEITLSSGKVVKKTLKPTATQAAQTALVPGKIHRLGNMPFMPVEEFDPENWVEFVPRNVYLSDISLPGSWNTLEPSAQDIVAGATPTQEGINTINKQYEKGCRAFHFDCRYLWIPNIVHHHDLVETIHHNKDGKSSITYWFSGWCTECYNRYKKREYHDNAYDEEVYNDYDADEGQPTLGVVQGNGTAQVAAFGNLYFMPSDNITFEEALNAIIANVKEDEYMVLSCSWAHNSTDPDTRTLDPAYASTWLKDISVTCANHSEVYDASTITPETTVGDVLGKVIVIVNLEHGINDGYTMPASSKCLFVNMPQVRTEAMYASGYMSNEYMYKVDKTHNGIKMANTLAQICSHNAALETARGWAPTYLQA
ncbi:MAG: hypothetical protein HUK03_10415, partial [Bacteroidaceae bacterium]|nr:hypothetical protein [Bacteroidaceae bacterium]